MAGGEILPDTGSIMQSLNYGQLKPAEVLHDRQTQVYHALLTSGVRLLKNLPGGKGEPLRPRLTLMIR